MLDYSWPKLLFLPTLTSDLADENACLQKKNMSRGKVL